MQPRFAYEARKLAVFPLTLPAHHAFCPPSGLALGNSLGPRDAPWESRSRLQTRSVPRGEEEENLEHPRVEPVSTHGENGTKQTTSWSWERNRNEPVLQRPASGSSYAIGPVFVRRSWSGVASSISKVREIQVTHFTGWWWFTMMIIAASFDDDAIKSV